MNTAATTPLSSDELDRLKSIVGDKGWIADPALLSPYLEEQRGLYQGGTAIMLRPATALEVADLVSFCAEAAIGVVPQGGNTGLVGGAVPSEGQREILLNLSRMNKISHIDSRNDTITVEAGCLLKTVQEAAENRDRLFPLSMGSEGSCEIGGNIATNAGGISVLRYGMMRDLVLGLEVVLADGRVLNELKGLRKDNSGYDLRQLFIGSEGTLGIITAAVLKLFPPQRNRITALLGIASPEAAIALFEKSRDVLGDPISAFEYMPRIALDLVTKHIPGTRDPFETPYPGYVLMELATTLPVTGLKADVEEHFSTAIKEGIAENALIAESNAQSQALWRLREAIPEAQKCEGGSIKHDVSVPVSAVARFIEQATAVVTKEIPNVRVVAFGHFGDGNVHFNLTQPKGADKTAFLALWPRMNGLVHDLACAEGGSISAEHGIGRLKRDELVRCADPLKIELMGRIKQALDPQNIMNPGKIIDI